MNKWKSEGLVNIVKLIKIDSITPLYLQIEDAENFEGSLISLLFCANMKDYLVKRETSELVEGDKKDKDVEHVWTFACTNGKWVCHNIEEVAVSLSYAKLENEIPESYAVTLATA